MEKSITSRNGKMLKRFEDMDFVQSGKIIVIALVYFVAGRACAQLSIAHANVTALCVSSGIGLAAIYFFGRPAWLAIFIASFAMRFSSGISFSTALGIAFGSSLSVLLGAKLLLLFNDFRSDFSRMKDVWSFCFFGAVITPLVSATFGVFFLWRDSLVASNNVLNTWMAWWSGDAIGILIAAPLLMVLISKSWRLSLTNRALEASLMLGVILYLILIEFSNSQNVIFFMYPVIAWAAIRMRQVGVMGVMFFLACVSYWLLVFRVSPSGRLEQSEILNMSYRLQLFLSTSGIAGMLLVADITSRMRAEAKLAEKEEQLQVILANTPDHIILQDLDLRYQLVVNPQLGLSIQDMLNKTDQDILTPSDAEALTTIKREVLRSGVPVNFETSLVSKTGGLEYFDGVYVPRRDRLGAVNGLIGYFRVITERKLAEKNRLAFEAAENANRAKDQFIATVSHELRTPLAAILAWAQLINSGRLSEEAKATGLRAIEECASTQNQLIDDLLDASRIVTGKLDLNPVRADALAVLGSAIAAIRASASKKSIVIIEEHDISEAMVMADPMRLKQIFWNLLSNSVKFTPSGGTIQILSDIVHEGERRVLRVRVKDSGEGIAQEVLPLLFQRFSQGDSSSTRAHGGMGLGLSISRSLLELQAGQIKAESEGLGKGATFTVYLPVLEKSTLVESLAFRQGEEPRSTRVSREERPLHKLKVLFVDDEFNTREAMRAALLSAGAVVEVADSVQTALSILAQFPADIAICDIAMPKEDGYDFMRRLRASSLERIRNLPAIAFSSFAAAEVEGAARNAGFRTYLPKPVDTHVLVRTILQSL